MLNHSSIKRRTTIPVKLGNVTIGGQSLISVQSMIKTDAYEISKIIDEVKKLEKVGCEIIRIAIPTKSSAKNIALIKQKIKIPIEADIHFDYKLAIESIKHGVDGIRLNPGNIKKKEEIKAVVDWAKQKDIPIRIGVNAGSIDRKKFPQITSLALVNSVLEYVKILETFKFFKIVISLKAFDVLTTIRAYEIMATKVDYPFHLGITEAGTLYNGIIRSSIGLGNLLLKGIGDTIRVSLTDRAEEEVKAGYKILQVLGLRDLGPIIISCPTCGRCKVNLIKIAREVEKKLVHLKKPLKIAIMGCVVNGPGEAKDADIGIAAGAGVGLLFKKGVVEKKVKEENMVESLVEEIKAMG